MAQVGHLFKQLSRAIDILGGIQQPPTCHEPSESFDLYEEEVEKGEEDVEMIAKEIFVSLTGRSPAAKSRRQLPKAKSHSVTVEELREMLEEADSNAPVLLRLREKDQTTGRTVSRFFTLHHSVVLGNPVGLFLSERPSRLPSKENHGTVYAVGWEESGGQYAMFYGPCETLSEVKAVIPSGRDLPAFILRFEGDGLTEPVYRWSLKKYRWVKV
jgi:hypothetical protein